MFADSADAPAETTDTRWDEPRPPACDLSRPFGTPTAIQGLPAGAVAARATRDELTMYYALDVNNYDVYVATRSTTADPFGVGRPVSEINSPFLDGTLSLSDDGLSAYFESNRSGDYRIYFMTRSAVAQPFTTPMPIDLGMSDGQGGPYLVPGSTSLYYHFPSAENALEIYRVDLRAPTSGRGTLVRGLSTPMSEADPVVTADELTIVFVSDRGGASAHGRLDLWIATRSSIADDFGSARNIDELNTPADEAPGSISPDGCRLYFGSGHTTYVASRPR